MARRSQATKRPKRRREARRKTVSIIYKRDGVSIRHIDMQVDQLPGEIARLVGVMAQVGKLLTAPRIRTIHPVIQHVRYILAYSPAPAGELTVDQMTQEIGRLNYLMNYALQVMNRMKSDYAVLEEVRFLLRYRQTSKKRGPGWNSFKGDREVESLPDPEQSEYDNNDD